MTDGREDQGPLRRSIGAIPADLAAVCGLLAVTIVVVFAPAISETPLRVPLGLAFVLFVPGYAFVAALFPEAGDDDGTADRRRGIDGIERVALSFGLSIAIVPLVGLTLNATPWGIRLGPVVVVLSGLTLALVAVGAYRRRQLPTGDRFRVPVRSWLAAGRAELFAPETRVDAALNVLLVGSVLLATASVGYAALGPDRGESFSELYLLSEGAEGELVADDYPTNYTVGQSRPLIVGIGNREGERTTYTVVLELQRLEGNATVTAETELERFSATLPANATRHRRIDVAPTMTGQGLRLAVLLYRGEPPAEPSVENAYRATHLLVNVSGPGG